MITGNRNLDVMILNKLDDVDLVNTCQTNRAADQICQDQTFWLNRILTKFPKLPIDVLDKYKGDRTWSEYYINDLRRIGLPPDPRDFDAYTPLERAVNDSRLDHVIILLSRGADVNEGLVSPLILATRNGNLPMVKYLVEHGADVNEGRGEIVGMITLFNNIMN